MKVLIGTNNLNKFQEYNHIFAKYAPNIKLFNPSDFKIDDDPEEDADTLLNNAVKKAKFFGKKSGIITLADDTGLFVDALNGEPGINTKRWHKGSDYDRCIKLLECLKGMPWEKRRARYKGAFAAYNPESNKLWKFLGGVEGFISNEFRGDGGFGYDRIFKLTSLEDKYYSELSIKELIEIGDRGRAVKELIFNTDFLK